MMFQIFYWLNNHCITNEKNLWSKTVTGPMTIDSKLTKNSFYLFFNLDVSIYGRLLPFLWMHLQRAKKKRNTLWINSYAHWFAKLKKNSVRERNVEKHTHTCPLEWKCQRYIEANHKTNVAIKILVSVLLHEHFCNTLLTLPILRRFLERSPS